MIGASFKLNFISSGHGEKPISEPIGFDVADFTVEQENNRYGRDVAFSGGESEFQFSKYSNHELDLLLYNFEIFGFESEVQLIIDINGSSVIVGDLDFATAETDQQTYFKCKVIQDSKRQIIKRRSDVKVDLFSGEDLDGNEITPVQTENILIKAKPIKQTSVLELPETYQFTEEESGIRGSERWYVNPYQALVQFEIEDTFIPFQPRSRSNIYRIIKAQNNIRDLKVEINDVDISIECNNSGGANGRVYFALEMWFGPQNNEDDVPNQKHTFFSDSVPVDQTRTVMGDFSFVIPFLNRGDAVFLAYNILIDKESVIGSIQKITEIRGGKITLTATSLGYNTISPSVRLRDAVAQNILSISQCLISFPFAEFNGEFYNQRILNGNLLRGIKDRPFYLSLKNIEDYLPEFNGDFEIQSDGSVFFGKYPDFYRNEEVGRFTEIQFDSFKKFFNERYTVNEFSYKYKKYQSQKENETENTYDSVHGESEWVLANRFVEGKKQVAVDWVRDAFSIEETRRKALDLNESTASQDDDTIYVIDTFPQTKDLTFQETAFLQHLYNEETGRLIINNDGSFSFVLLGIVTATTFTILGSDINAGTYSVFEVGERYIELLPLTPISVNGDGERNTGFEYQVLAETISGGVSWGIEGFTVVDGINEVENYANLKYSIKRNIIRFYNEYLATCNLFKQLPIKNTFYKNNPDAVLNYEGLTTIEGENFTPTNPILSPFVYEMVLITDYLTFKTLETNLRTKRGFIRVFDGLNHVIKVYPKKMVFNPETSELEITGEEKYQQSVINITSAVQGFLTINDEYIVTGLKYKFDNENLYIFDNDGLLLYNPILWQKVSVNGASATTKEELEEWLMSIS